ncbi:hybrid sensor histidine kinase/response regulator [Neptunicoccus sediminis]|uniref:hybrid sensor histidine kinase/response regulator n=1 Tax=Neptunicoccus sediminis TaxID=1892596 RepID=UPI000845C42A|nr:hybrid sensor histidine kinase/response regulator [Neptunicoccus sediminis]
MHPNDFYAHLRGAQPGSCLAPINPMSCYSIDQAEAGQATCLQQYDDSLPAPRVTGRILASFPLGGAGIHPRSPLVVRQFSDASERSLEVSANSADNILNDLPDPVLRCTPKGRVIYGNKSFRSLKTALLSRPASGLSLRFSAGMPREAFDSVVAGLTREKPHTVLQQTISDTGIDVRVFEWSITKRFVGATVQELLCVGRNVSAHAREKEHLTERAIKSEARNHEKSLFVADLGHELKNPLNGMMGMAELLACSALADQQSGYVKNILAGGTELQTLLKDIVDLAVVDTGAITMVEEPFHLPDILDEVRSLYGGRASDVLKPLEFALDTTCEHPLVGCRGRIKQVLTNLVLNAINYADAGAIRISASVEFGPPDQPSLFLCVEDNGPGIADEDKTRIFHRFTRLDGGTDRSEGHGLGLSISREICIRHGGELTVTDSSRGGARFEAVFRVNTLQAKVEAPASPLAQLQKMNLDLNVLIVEDNELNAAFLQQILGQSGARVTLAENGAAGLDHILSEQFDVVFTDIRMPVMGGVEMLQAYDQNRLHGCNRPYFVASSGATETEGAMNLQSVGFDTVLEKPVSIAHIANLLSDFIVADSNNRKGCADTKPEQRGF